MNNKCKRCSGDEGIPVSENYSKICTSCKETENKSEELIDEIAQAFIKISGKYSKEVWDKENKYFHDLSLQDNFIPFKEGFKAGIKYQKENK